MWKILGRLKLLEWAIKKVVLIVFLVVVVMSAAIIWARELPLLWQVLVILGSGLTAGLIAGGLLALLKKWRLALAPAQEESELQRQMLSFILSLIGERPVTTTEIYCREPFLKIPPSALHQAFIHLQTNGYIIAEEDTGNNPLAPRSTRMFTVTAVTDKGKKAI